MVHQSLLYPREAFRKKENKASETTTTKKKEGKKREEDNTVVCRDKTFPRIQKQYPDSKTRPRIQNTFHNAATLGSITNHCTGYEPSIHPRREIELPISIFLPRVLDSGVKQK